MRYVVRGGEHLEAIAYRFGVSASELWSAPANRALRERRGLDGHVLFPGDVLEVPEPPARNPRAIAIGGTTSFRASVPRVPVVVRLTDGGAPLAGEPFRVEGDGPPRAGESDGEGVARFEVRVTTRQVALALPGRGASLALSLGGLDPLSEWSGVQGRLAGLGLYSGPLDGRPSDATRDALRRLQALAGLPLTGELDDASRAALAERYGA